MTFEFEPRSITVLAVTFIVCLYGGLTVYLITGNSTLTWIVIAVSYVIVVSVLSVLTSKGTE